MRKHELGGRLQPTGDTIELRGQVLVSGDMIDSKGATDRPPRSARRSSARGCIGVTMSSGPQSRDRAISSEVDAV
jgi:hypothetical protein